MKKLTLTLFIFSFVFAVTAASGCAQTVVQLRAHIPFDFAVAGQTLPAGDYFVERIDRQTSQETVLIRNTQGRARVLVRMGPIHAKSTPDLSRLIFSDYAGRYFLSQLFVSGEEIGLELPRSRAARYWRERAEYSSNGSNAGTVVEVPLSFRRH